MLTAALLKWDRPVPLMMAERYGPAFKTLGGRGRLRPGEPAFARAVCLALVEATGAALRTADDIARRAETLRTAAPIAFPCVGAITRTSLLPNTLAMSVTTLALSTKGKKRNAFLW